MPKNKSKKLDGGISGYDRLEDAVKARKRGEEMHDDFLERYHSAHSQEIAAK